jgi:hypothetical protein
LRQRRERAKRKAAQSKECDFGDALSVHNKLNTDRDRRVFQRIQKNLSCVLWESGATALL